MSEISEKLEYLEDTKELIKAAILNKGVDVDNDDPFRLYATKIGEIVTKAQTLDVPIWYYSGEIIGNNHTLSYYIENNDTYYIRANSSHLSRLDEFSTQRQSAQAGDIIVVDWCNLYEDDQTQTIAPYILVGEIVQIENNTVAVISVVDGVPVSLINRNTLIKPENIRSGVSFLGTTGTMEAGKLSQEEYDEDVYMCQFILGLSGQYRELQYLSMTGTQHIATGCQIISGYEFITEIKYLFQSNYSGMGRIIGTDYDQTYEIATTWQSDSSFRWGVNGSGTTYEVTPQVPHIYKLHTNGRLDVDGTTVQNAGSAYSRNSYIYLFTGYDSQKAIGTFYYCKMWNNNNVLIRDFIPVQRSSDDTVCLYDKISQTYFLNAGTGTFTPGPIVEE